MFTNIKDFVLILINLDYRKNGRESTTNMQNLLKSCDLEQFRSLFQEKNIDLASLRLLVDDQASTQVK